MQVMAFGNWLTFICGFWLFVLNVVWLLFSKETGHVWTHTMTAAFVLAVMVRAARQPYVTLKPEFPPQSPTPPPGGDTSNDPS